MKIKDNIYDDNESASSAVISVSMSTRCGASSGCDGRESHQMWSVTGNIE